MAPASGMSDLIAGPDGGLWFATSGWIGKISPQGKVKGYKIPRGTLGYPESRAPRLAVGTDGLVYFTSLNGIGSINTKGRFGVWQKVSPDPIGLKLLVRGADEQLWAFGGDGDSRIYHKEQDGLWSTTGSNWYKLAATHVPVFETAAADPTGGGVFEIDALHYEEDNIGTSLYTEFVGPIRVDGGVFSDPWQRLQLSDATPGIPFQSVTLGPATWEGEYGVSPGRFSIVTLPDGRVWVSLRDWDGGESYNKQRGLRKPAPKGKARVQRVWREKGTVLARIGCTGPTGGWCQGTVKASMHAHKRSVKFTIPAAPAKVKSASTARLRLSSAQTGDINKGRRITIKIAGRTWRIK
jgi:hypothetical protein